MADKKKSSLLADKNDDKERIAKRIARAGMCSRREAEKWIEEGRVILNGKLVTSPATQVSDEDKILIDKKPLPERERTRLWLFHKPKGTITTHSDPQKRPRIFDLLPKNLPRVISIGRLDFNSEGLLLLTNDGELARKLEHPSNGWKRRYRVRAFGRLDADKLTHLQKGVTVDGIRYAPIEISHEQSRGQNHWLLITLSEGKNREIRKLLSSIDLTVNRLLRIAYGPFQLGNLEACEIKEVPSKIIKEQIG